MYTTYFSLQRSDESLFKNRRSSAWPLVEKNLFPSREAQVGHKKESA